MIRSYLTTALRSLTRHKGYTAVHVLGLTIGLAAALLVGLYIQHSTSFDRFHEHHDRIYRVLLHADLFPEHPWQRSMPDDLRAIMRNQDAQVEDVVRFHHSDADQVAAQERTAEGIVVRYTDSNLFEVFSFELLIGNPKTVLDAPRTAVLTRSVARRLFGENNPVGETISVPSSEGAGVYEVTGVMADMPRNSHLVVDLLLSGATLGVGGSVPKWTHEPYLLLRPNADPEAVATRILTYVREVEEKEYMDFARLEPIKDAYFSDAPAARQGDIRYVYLLFGIGVLVLLMACANYINLSTARAAQRLREVGVRKALGASTGQLMRQYLAETVLLTCLVLPMAFLLLMVVMPHFNTYAQVELTPGDVLKGAFIWMAVAVVLFTGLASGVYPALVLAKQNASATLRGGKTGRQKGRLRKTLVVFQFASSIVLMAATLVVVAQLRHMNDRPLGFTPQHVMVIPIEDEMLRAQPEPLMQAIREVATVEHVASALGLPGQQRFVAVMMGILLDPADEDHFVVPHPPVDSTFLSVMGIPLLAGRSFDTHSAERSEIIVNESAVSILGWNSPEDALGKMLMGDLEVVGVAADFNYQSLHKAVRPLAMQPGRSAWQLAVRFQPGTEAQTRAAIASLWPRFEHTEPFEPTLLEDDLANLYGSETRTAAVLTAFAALAIFIACLGLIGLTAYTAEQRRKEIGIRKVLGARISQIVTLLTRDVGALLLVAALCAAPLVFGFMPMWLEQFAYRIDLGAHVLALACGLVGLIILLPITYQAVRAAAQNPANSLRSE
ncbi:MAG: ABC transporter permease [Bacteroidota bacterium]